MLLRSILALLCFMQLALLTNFAAADDLDTDKFNREIEERKNRYAERYTQAVENGLDFEQLREELASPDYETRSSAVRLLYDIGEKRPLEKDEIELLLPNLKSDPDWRIKTRIICLLPFAGDPAWVLEPLLSALKDREYFSSGGGNVPSYACRSLVDIGDPKTLGPMEDWLMYLKTHPRVYGDLTAKLADTTQKRIDELKAKIEQNKAVQ